MASIIFFNSHFNNFFKNYILKTLLLLQKIATLYLAPTRKWKVTTKNPFIKCRQKKYQNDP